LGNFLYPFFIELLMHIYLIT